MSAHLKDIQTLDRQIVDAIGEIKELDNYVTNVETRISERIQHIAGLLEEKMRLTGTPEFVNTICSTIIRLFRDAHLESRVSTVVKCLPDTYKLLHKSTSHLSESSDKPIEECSIVLDEITTRIKTLKSMDLNQCTRRQLQDLVVDITDVEDRVTDFCTDNNIETTTTGESHSWINALYGNKAPAIALEKAPDALNTPDSDAKEWLRLSKIAAEIAQARMDYPNHDDRRRYDETNAVRALNNLLEPIINRKYRYDPGMMNDMMFEAISQSGTAAASHSGVICANTINAKTGLPELRKITKEQLDAICLPFYNKMNHVLYSLPLFGPVLKNAYEQFRAADATYLAKRAKEVGPKLQKIK